MYIERESDGDHVCTLYMSCRRVHTYYMSQYTLQLHNICTATS